MSVKPKAAAVCATARRYATREPPVLYVKGGETDDKQDCQGHIERCVRVNGGQMAYAGSNDMFRNACTWVGTLAEARAQGKLVPAALLFLVTHTGDYPEKYHADGKGNASHVGLYIGDPDILITHAAASAGRVTTSSFASTWTHVGLAKAIDYAEGGGIALTRYAVVTADSGSTVNLRAHPNGQSVVLERVPVGTQVAVESTINGYGRLTYGGKGGYMLEDFLQYLDAGGGEQEEGAFDRAKALEAYRLLGQALGVDV